MAAVRSNAQKIGHRLAIAAVIVITIAMLAPIYWIASTAFKPRSLATTVPPTVVFTPEITPFIKLFTKRVQLQKKPDQATYDEAPWWEKKIYDAGERVLKVAGGPQMSAYPSRARSPLTVSPVLRLPVKRIFCFLFSPPACCRQLSSPFRCS